MARQTGGRRRRGEDPRRAPPSSMEFWMGALEESPVPFAAEHPSLETYQSVYQAVLRAYDWRCALTGVAYEPVAGLHPELQVTAIRPLVLGGTLHVGNFIALCPDADRAFSRGHLAIGPEYRVFADLATLDPELLERLNPDGRIRLPSGTPPDSEALHWHLTGVFGSQPLGRMIP